MTPQQTPAVPLTEHELQLVLIQLASYVRTVAMDVVRSSPDIVQVSYKVAGLVRSEGSGDHVVKRVLVQHDPTRMTDAELEALSSAMLAELTDRAIARAQADTPGQESDR
ncbi:MAG TPA: hypothetical protein VGJ44_27090 [Kribbellaceae bacterium]|jgi:hypothetical protein